MPFTIRRNHPHIGAITMYTFPNGGFVAREWVVPERAFWSEVARVLDKITPSVREKLLQKPAQSVEPPPPPSHTKTVKLRKTASAAS